MGFAAATTCFLASDNGAFGYCWYRICDALALLFMQSMDLRIAALAAAMIWVCLAVSKVVSFFSAPMRWLQASLLVW